MKLAILDYSESKVFILDYEGLDDSEMIEEALTKAGFNLDEIEWMSGEIEIEEGGINDFLEKNNERNTSHANEKKRE